MLGLSSEYYSVDIDGKGSQDHNCNTNNNNDKNNNGYGNFKRFHEAVAVLPPTHGPLGTVSVH